MNKVVKMHYLPVVYLKQFAYTPNLKSRKQKIYALKKSSLSKDHKITKADFISERSVASFCTKLRIYTQETEKMFDRDLESPINSIFDNINKFQDLNQIPKADWEILLKFIITLLSRHPNRRNFIKERSESTDNNITETQDREILASQKSFELLERDNLIALQVNQTRELYITSDHPVIDQLNMGFYGDIVACAQLRDRQNMLVFPISPELLIFITPKSEIPKSQYPEYFKHKAILDQSKSRDIGTIRYWNALQIYSAKEFIFVPDISSSTITMLNTIIRKEKWCLGNVTYSTKLIIPKRLVEKKLKKRDNGTL